jgi:CRP-like cAMP-binding protein
MAEATVDILKKVPLLAGLDTRELASLASALRPRTFAAGKPAVEEGRGGAGFFIVLSGTCTVAIGGEIVNSLGAGDYFGEVALLSEDGLRTATVTPEGDLECVGLASWEFKAFLQEHPDVAWHILQTVAKRS